MPSSLVLYHKSKNGIYITDMYITVTIIQCKTILVVNMLSQISQYQSAVTIIYRNVISNFMHGQPTAQGQIITLQS
jgi:hypothetical protein